MNQAAEIFVGGVIVFAILFVVGSIIHLVWFSWPERKNRYNNQHSLERELKKREAALEEKRKNAINLIQEMRW